MRTYNSQQIARPDFYDRNPAIQTLAYQASGTAPAAEAARWTYTVPAGKKAKVMAANCSIHRVTVAAPVGRIQGYVQYQPGGAGDVRILYCTLVTNNVGDNRSQNVGESLSMVAGDVLRGVSGDTSTGGTADFTIAASVMEYDA